MSRSRCTALLAFSLAALAPWVLAWYLANPFQAASGSPANPSPPAPAAADAPRASYFAGNDKCSGRGCHGGLEANPAPAVAQDEYSRWTTHDKHGQAFAVLSSERGDRIAKNLAATNPEGKVIPAARDLRCLACHVTPELARAVISSPAIHPLAKDGVGCEACHGPANAPKSWLDEHTRGSWKERKAKNEQALFDEYHMTNLGNLQVQATTCVGCHVGAPADPDHGIPARDLNHDLMAAGHPRLTFELTSFRDNMPPHWQKNKHARETDYEARSWGVGQVVAARASLDLLRDRARRAEDENNPAPWPEFAEADCFSCHAGLRVPSWRGPDYRGTRSLGAIPYSSWYTVMLPFVAPGHGLADQVTADFKSIRSLMNQPAPPRKQVILACDKLLGDGAASKDAPLSKLAALVDRPQHFNPETTRKILSSIRAEGEKRKDGLNWDDIEQMTLAVSALTPSGDDKVRKALEALWKTDLAYPPERESPAVFRREDFPKHWKALLDSLPQ